MVEPCELLLVEGAFDPLFRVVAGVKQGCSDVDEILE
jgi:hypothetical protein